MNNIISQEEKNQIDVLCEQYNIENYTINNDGSIDVNGNVALNGLEITELPLKFRNVFGDFNINYNQLTSLEGCPTSISGNFNCHNNRDLVTLEGGPVEVGGYVNCGDNELTSLQFCPKKIGGSFYCYYNQLTSLVGCPTSISGEFKCIYNKLTSLVGCPTSISRDFICSFNKLTTLEHCPDEVGGNFNCDHNKLPEVFVTKSKALTKEERTILHKYQNDYEIWVPEFNLENLDDLIADIKDGLK